VYLFVVETGVIRCCRSYSGICRNSVQNRVWTLWEAMCTLSLDHQCIQVFVMLTFACKCIQYCIVNCRSRFFVPSV